MKTSTTQVVAAKTVPEFTFPGIPQPFASFGLLGAESAEWQGLLDTEATFSIGRNQRAAKGMNIHTRTWREWLNLPRGITDHTTGKKDGPGIVFGELAEGHRKESAIVRVSALALDIDNGDSLTAALDRIQDSGFAAVVYTSHSHGKTETKIPAKAIERDGLAGSLRGKGWTPELVASASEIDRVRTADGEAVVVRHAPIDKFRVVLPLFEAQEFDPDHSRTVAAFKRKVLGIAEALDLTTDPATLNPAHFFYLPRHPKGADNYENWVVRGSPLRWAECPEKDLPSTQNRRKGTPPRLPSGAAFPPRSEMALATFIEGVAPERIRGTNGDKVFVECPNAVRHSSTNPTDSYTTDADVGGVATWHCSHGSCAGDGTLERINAAIVGGWFSESAFLSSEIDGGAIMLPLDPEPDPEPAQTQASADPQPLESLRDPLPKDLDAALETLSRRWAAVAIGGRIRVVPRLGEYVAFPPAEFVAYHAADRRKGGDRTIDPAAVWLARQRPLNGVTFQPVTGNATAPADKLNLWRGWETLPEGEATSARIWSFLEEVVCDNDAAAFAWLRLWLAHLVQRPDEKPGTALVISGKGGAGKSFLGSLLTQLVGDRYSALVSRSEDITGQFTAHLATALLVVSEEAEHGPKTASALKHLVTTPTQRLESKGVDSQTVPSYARCVFLANRTPVIVSDDGSDRRWFCLRISDSRVGDLAYFEGLAASAANGGLARFREDLLAYDLSAGGLSWSAVRIAPETEAKKAMRADSATSPEAAILSLVEEGGFTVRLAHGETVRYRLAEDVENPLGSEHLRQFVAVRSGARSDSVIAEAIARLGPKGRRTVAFERLDSDGEAEAQSEKMRCVVVPPLGAIRARFADRFSV